MIAKNCTIDDLQKALVEVNRRFDGNIDFREIEQQGRAIRFTLRVKDCKAPGHGRSCRGRRLVTACWHAHGHFFDAVHRINPKAIIVTMYAKITAQGGNWVDWNAGSIMFPHQASQACDCN